MQPCVSERHKNNCVGPEVTCSKCKTICTGHLPGTCAAAEFLMMFSEVTNILYLYILDQNFDIYCSCTFWSFLLGGGCVSKETTWCSVYTCEYTQMMPSEINCAADNKMSGCQIIVRSTYFIISYVWLFCLHVICVPHACLVPTNVRRGIWIPWDPIHSQPLVSHHVVTRDWGQVFCKSKKCS